MGAECLCTINQGSLDVDARPGLSGAPTEPQNSLVGPVGVSGLEKLSFLRFNDHVDEVE